jgi:hypothetical protein
MMGAPISGLAGAAAAAVKLGPIDTALAAFNTNPYFIGLMMLILNLGGRFLAMEVTKGQEYFLSHPIVRRTLIFVVLFIATRNIVIAFWLWLAIVVLLGYLFNENSALCVFGRRGMPGSTCATRPAGPEPPKPTDQEISIFKMLSEKVKNYEAFQNQDDTAATDASGEQPQEDVVTPAVQTTGAVKVIGKSNVEVINSTAPKNKPTLKQGELVALISNEVRKGQNDPMTS